MQARKMHRNEGKVQKKREMVLIMIKNAKK